MEDMVVVLEKEKECFWMRSYTKATIPYTASIIFVFKFFGKNAK